ncbi:hypothetical protein KDH_39850 [Dictyobacter sp. S3.2.2.5]|uniref:CN hydrolase domain-containing protein n=1 Tax=Dictyobacter halimunensis TaxID=3026934 RepID=A0ABQ6FWH7_9CHLR|nr:hypothetical protein KDH_39850 [Dictyobacter sp. S3.2.2.5]
MHSSLASKLLARLHACTPDCQGASETVKQKKSCGIIWLPEAYNVHALPALRRDGAKQAYYLDACDKLGMRRCA